MYHTQKCSDWRSEVLLYYAKRLKFHFTDHIEIHKNRVFDYLKLSNVFSCCRSGLDIEQVKSKDGKTMQPLCMAQHYQMYRIYRRPGVNGDEQVILDRTVSGNHIIVAHHNQVYL